MLVVGLFDLMATNESYRPTLAINYDNNVTAWPISPLPRSFGDNGRSIFFISQW